MKGHQVDTWGAGLNEESQGSMQKFFARPCQYSSTFTINTECIKLIFMCLSDITTCDEISSQYSHTQSNQTPALEVGGASERG